MMQMRPGQAFRAALLGVSIAIAPSVSSAQVSQQGTSVIDDLLTRAQNSLNDLQYSQAIAFAKQVLDLGDRVSGDKQERAMFIVAAANFPEGEPAAQNRAVALATFRQMVRNKLDLTIPQSMRWAGLDSVLAEAKRTTFGLAAGATPQQEAVGPNGAIEFTARASRPSNFSVSISGPNALRVSDTTGAGQVTLRIPTMRNDRPLFASGEYQIIVQAIDRQTGDTASMKYVATVTAPPLTFATVPVALDSSRILAERTGKFGWKGIIVGGLVAGGIYGLSNVLHADTSMKTRVGPDAKGTGVAAAAGVAVILASFADRGRPIPSAITANRRLHDDFAASIRNAQAENANRIATHKTQFIITPGGR
jgi:hypothetical protein